MKNRYSSLVVFVVLVFCAVAAHAEEQYQAEISVGSSRTDTGQDVRIVMDSVSAEVFFAPVKTVEHPYAEAAFLERIGSVMFSTSSLGIKADPVNGDGQDISAGVSYAKPDSSLAIQATYGKLKYSYDAPFYTSYKDNSYSLSIGNYFTQALLAGVNYANSKTEGTSPGRPTFNLTYTDYGVFAKYVNELEHGNALSFNGSLSSSTSDDGTRSLKNTSEHFSVEYFFNRG